jgi:hypothetical protein
MSRVARFIALTKGILSKLEINISSFILNMVKFDINALWQAICYAFNFIAAMFTLLFNFDRGWPNKSYTHQASSHSHQSPPHTLASKNTE